MRNQKIAQLLHQYFELGVAEGREGRSHDTEAGDAQRVLSEIEAEIAALSAAEPEKPATEEYGHPEWIWYCECQTGPMVTLGRWAKDPRQKRYKLADIQPTEHDHPAPSVAVKALEWKAHNEGFGYGRMYYGTGAFGHWYGVSRVKTGCWSCVHHVGGKPVHLPMTESLESAKAAAQADYEARIRSALSAQVQDVVGWQSIESAPKDGTQFLAFEIGGYFNCWWHDNGTGEQYWMDEADSEPNPSHWMPLPAAPAKQEG